MRSLLFKELHRSVCPCRRVSIEAAAHHRSMNREVIAILERELERPASTELPPPVQTLKPIGHDEIVRIIREARDGKR